MCTKIEHIQAIKERLRKIVGEMNLNQVKTIIVEKTGCDFHYDTVRNSLNASSNALDIMVVTAVARAFNADIAQILALPGEASEQLTGVDYGRHKIEELTDPKYWNKTYGYLYSSKLSRGEIDSFCLDIRCVEKKVYATFTLHYHSTKDGTTIIKKKEYSGVPYLVNQKNIYITLRDIVGDIINLSFSYVPYNAHQIYFRRGSVVTQAREAHRAPLIQTFVMFDLPLAEEEMKYVPGFLALTDGFDVLHIPVKEFDELCESDEDVKVLCSTCSYFFSKEHSQYHTVTEQQLLANSHKQIPREQALRAMLRIKGISEAPNRVSIPENDEIAEFSRSLKKDRTLWNKG